MFKSFLLAASVLGSVADPLMLTPLIQQGKIAEAVALSKVTGLGESNMGHSGFLTVPSATGKQDNNIFFWLQPCLDGCEPDAPFVLWLQGGPGGPGTFGAFGEIGNWYVDFNLDTQDRCFSWCKQYNCLFVDQPTMTGFSFPTDPATGKFNPKNIEYTKTSAQAMEQVYGVVQQVFEIFPEYRPAPFYITGESYGGLYTPNLGYVIVNHNAAGKDKPINFVGLAVGDPVINWKYQMPTYPTTLHSFGVVMQEEARQLEDILAQAVARLDNDCWGAFTLWNSIWADDSGGGLPGLFAKFTGSSATDNVLLGGPPAAMSYWVNYLQNETVKKAFHFDGIPTSSVAEGGDVYHTMVNSTDYCMNSSWIYADLFVNHGIDLMIYTSTMDTLLGPPTTEPGVQSVWDYAQASLKGGDIAAASWRAAPKAIWKTTAADSQPAGYAKCFEFMAPSTKGKTTEAGKAQRFCYTVVRNGGHELPAYQPRTSYDMFRRFIEGRAYDASGNDDSKVPKCAQCGGMPPFTGSALPDCPQPPKKEL